MNKLTEKANKKTLVYHGNRSKKNNFMIMRCPDDDINC
jgi:hypothetical protein